MRKRSEVASQMALAANQAQQAPALDRESIVAPSKSVRTELESIQDLRPTFEVLDLSSAFLRLNNFDVILMASSNEAKGRSIADALNLDMSASVKYW